jgi:hypothetical protein
MSRNPFLCCSSSRNSSYSSNSRKRNENPFLGSHGGNSGNSGNSGNMFLPHGLTADVAAAVDRPGPAPGPMSFEEAFPTLGKASPSATNLNLNLNLNFKTAVQKNVPAAQSEQSQSLAQSLAQSQQLQSQQLQSQPLVLNHRLRTNMFMFPQRHERRDEHDEHNDDNDDNDDNHNGCSEGAYDSAYTKYYND